MLRRCLAISLCVLACAGPRALASDRIPVVEEGGIRDRWMLAEGVPLVAPKYPQALARRGDEACVAVGYLLNADGTTSDYALLKAWNSVAGDGEPVPGYWVAFAEAAGDALKQWRFKPRPEVTVPKPVYTVGTFVFGMHGAPTQLRQRCAIPRLADRLRALRGDRHAAGILDRLDLDAARDAQRIAAPTYQP